MASESSRPASQSDFIKVNGRILDLKKYEREVLLLKEFLLYRFEEIVLQYGFSIENNNRENKESESGIYYNKELDLVLEINFKKRIEIEYI